MNTNHKDFILMMADNLMIGGQRLGEWCGHGPVLEQDIALTNIALDMIGEARNYYHYLAEIEGKKEDDYPMLRSDREFKNILMMELPIGHWGDTIMKHFMFDCYHYFLLYGLKNSTDQTLSAIANKSIKESAYHLSYSSEWVIRLGDGTDESHQKMQGSLNKYLLYFEEMFLPTDYELYCINEGICPDLAQVKEEALSKFSQVISEATLTFSRDHFSHTGGKRGLHTEHLGHILSEMQYMQRVYPNATW